MTKDEILERWVNRVEALNSVQISIPIKAVSKERPRAARNGHFYTPKKTADFEKEVATYANMTLDQPFSEPLKVKVAIIEEVPKSWSEDKRLLAQHRLIVPTKGDLDNQVKAVTDALNGVAYIDDAQICHLRATKRYGYKNEIWIELRPIGLSPQQIEQALYSMKNAKADKWRQTSS